MEELDQYQQEEIRVEAIASGLRDAGLSANAQDTGGDTLCVIVDRADGGLIAGAWPTPIGVLPLKTRTASSSQESRRIAQAMRKTSRRL